jgi:hypothetical protein
MIINTEQVSIPKVEEKPIEKKQVKLVKKHEEVIEIIEVRKIV